MKKIGIMTDSHSGILTEEAEKLGIKVLPMPFYIDDELYLEGVDLSREEFYEKLRQGVNVSTSQPSPQEVMETWDDMLKEYETLIYIPISSGLSGSCMTAQGLAQDEEYEGKVFVVDNGHVSTPLHRSVLDAVAMAEAGYSAVEIKKILEETKEQMVIYVGLSTLEYLKKGGRISSTSALLANVLNIKPVMKFGTGVLDVYQKCRDTSVFHERDEQEKERLQLAFEKADSASRAKTEFVNRMSHDIRTPINGIMGMLDIIRKNKDNPEKLEECLGKIQLSAGHLMALADDVLDMSKLESGKLVLEEVSFDLLQLMADVTSLVNAQLLEMKLSHHTHRKNLKHTILIGSPTRLRQIMLNLFSNAIKYNKVGGTIDTYSKEISCDGTTVWYEFKIKDSGIGMSEEFVKEELFDIFTQEQAGARTHYKGSGLGMSIVKQLVEAMHGTIEVKSTLGEGTTFILHLPFKIDMGTGTNGADENYSLNRQYEQNIEEKGRSNLSDTEKEVEKTSMSLPENKTNNLSDNTESVQNDLHGTKVLLVEDNDLNMEIAEFYLEDYGATVEKAWNGQEAFDKFIASAPGTYDIILMDIMMPVMDGLSACRAIRASDHADSAAVPIIAMTAQVSKESIEESILAGMNGHLTKPVASEKLIKTIMKFINL